MCTPSATNSLEGRPTTLLLWMQGLYFLATGVWPLVSIETFQLITGRKTDHLVTGREGDHWLVMTVAVLVISISLPLLHSARLGRATSELLILGVGSAVGLATIDVIYVVRSTISPIYLVDAAIEVALIAAWLTLRWRYRGNAGQPA